MAMMVPMLKSINLFTNKEIQDKELIKRELNLKELHEVIEKENSEITFNLNKETNFKLKCKHVERNRRKKIVWYGESTDHKVFTMIVVNHIDDKEFSFYGEVVKKDTQYLITSIDHTSNVVVTKNKITIEHKCGTCDSPKPSLEPRDIKTVIGEPEKTSKATHSNTIETSEKSYEVANLDELKQLEQDSTTQVTLKILCVYNKKTKDKLEEKAKGTPQVGHKETGKEIIEYLAHVAEDTTNTILKNSNINARVHVVTHEVEDDNNLLYAVNIETVQKALFDINYEKNFIKDRDIPEVKTLFNLKQKEKADVVCFFIPGLIARESWEEEPTPSAGVANSIPGSLYNLISHEDTLGRSRFFGIRLLKKTNGNYVSLSMPVFSHELAHTLGASHPYALNMKTPKFDMFSDLYWMSGYHLLDGTHSTVMGYKTAIPYYSSPNNQEAQNNIKNI